MEKITLIDVQHSITPEFIKTIRMIYFAIMGGATFFLLTVIYIYFDKTQNLILNEQNIKTINLFSIIHGLFFVPCLFLSNIIYNSFFSEKKVELMVKKMKIDNSSNLAVSYLGIIQTSKIIYMAILEVPVFFGLVICFIAVTNSVIYHYSYYWLNLLSYLTFMYLLIKDIPSEDKIIEIFKTKLKYLLKY